MFVINKMFVILSFVEYPHNEKLLYIFRTRIEIKGYEMEKEKESLLKMKICSQTTKRCRFVIGSFDTIGKRMV